MGPVLIPVAIAAASAAAGVALGAVTATAAVISVAATAVAAVVSYSTSKLPEPELASGASFATAAAPGASIAALQTPLNAVRALPVRQPLPPRRFVYGQCKVGGAVLYQGVDEGDGNYLLVLSALSDGVIESVDKFYLGAEEVPVDGSLNASSGSRFFGLVKFETATGLSTQTTSSLLSTHVPTTATTDFRQRGIARAVARLKWGSDASNHNYVYGEGIEPSYLIKGVKVYDPRDGAQDVADSTTWAYSDNPALCVAHAMTNAWQSAISSDAVDWDSVAEAADDCDDASFTLAGVVQSDIPLASQLADMLASFGGLISYENGLYTIRADKARSSVWTVLDSDILALAEMQFEADAAVYFDAVKAVYYDTANDGIRITSPVIQIGSGQRETSLDLAFVNASQPAQVLAYRKLIRDRDGRALSITLSDAAIDLVPGEVFTINSNAFAFANGDWQVIQLDLSAVGCIVTARRYLLSAFRAPSEYVT